MGGRNHSPLRTLIDTPSSSFLIQYDNINNTICNGIVKNVLIRDLDPERSNLDPGGFFRLPKDHLPYLIFSI